MRSVAGLGVAMLLASVAGASELQLRTYDTRAGLGNAPITSMAADAAGKLWFTTFGGGVASYDGIHGVSGQRQATSLAVLAASDGAVFVLGQGANEHEGTIASVLPNHLAWVARGADAPLLTGVVTREFVFAASALGSLYRLKAGALEPFGDLKDRVVTQLAAAPDGTLWGIARWPGPDPDGWAIVFRREGETIVRYGPQWGLPRGGFRDLAVDATGSPWVATSTGVYRLSGGRFRVPEATGADLAKPAWSLYLQGPDRVWVGQQGGAVLLAAGHATRYALPREMQDLPLLQVLEAPDGAFWAVAPDLVLRVDGREAATFKLAPAPGAEQGDPELYVVRARETNGVLHLDREGGVWILDGMRALRYEGTRVRLFDTSSGLPADTITALSFDADGRLWVGTTRGLTRWNDETASFTAVAGLDEPVATLTAGAGGVICGASTTRSFRVAAGKAETWPPPGGVEGVQAMAFDAQGRLWAATARGLARVAPDGSHLVAEDAGAAPGAATCLMRVEDKLYAGFAGGLSVIAGDKVERVVAFDGKSVRLLVSGPGAAYALVGENLLDLAGEPILGYLDAGGDASLALLIDHAGRRWRASTDGIRVMNDRFGIRLGGVLPAGARVTALAESPRGEMWIGTTLGLVRYRPAAAAPAPRIEAWTASDPTPSPQTAGDDHGQWTPSPREITLQPSTALVFKLNGTSFADARDAAALLYLVRMVPKADSGGVDASWRLADDGIFPYASLRPGRYRFEARALSADALYSATAAVAITVPEPPATETAPPPPQTGP